MFLFGKVFQKDLISFQNIKTGKDRGFFRVNFGRGSEIFLRVRKEYPKTFLKADNKFLSLGYGNDKKNEFLRIKISQNQFTIKRDLYCGLPVFYFFIKNTLFFSNDYSFLVSLFKRNNAPIKLDLENLLLSFLGCENLRETFIKDIKVLSERDYLILTSKYFRRVKPQLSELDLKNNKLNFNEAVSNFRSLISGRIEKILSQIHSEEKIGFEISGGLDSLIVLNFTSKYLKHPPKIFSIVVDKNQEKTVKKIAKIFKAKLYTVYLKDKLPLSNLRRFQKPVFYREEIYFEAVEKISEMASKNGVSVLFGGMGGDELFKKDWVEDFKERKVQVKLPNFLNFGINWVGYKFEKPKIGYSVIQSNISRNNIFISKNIWPVSPLAFEEIFKFVRGLPRGFKKDKILFKKILRSDINFETDKTVLSQGFKLMFKKRESIQFILNSISNSRLADLGIVNRDLAKEFFLKNLKSGNLRNLFWVYELIRSEHSF